MGGAGGSRGRVPAGQAARRRVRPPAVVYATALAEARFRAAPPPDVAAAIAAELTASEIEAVEAVARSMALANLTASTAEALLGRGRAPRG
jgi:hypothetical protein